MTFLRCSVLALLAACVATPTAPPDHPVVNVIGISGSLAFDRAGVLTLTLDEPCVPTVHEGPYRRPVIDQPTDCSRPRVLARTPWGAVVPGEWRDDKTLTFSPDWAKTGLDPLDEHVLQILSQPWTLGDESWLPRNRDAVRMSELIGDATDTQVGLVSGGPPPHLEVTAIDVAGGALEPGGATTLTIRVANKGEGDAYRVRVTTRSSIASLHDQVLSFGRIAVGAEKTRTLSVHLPLTENAPDTMLVLSFVEGNGFVPHDVSRRVQIRPAVDAPELTSRCAVVDHDEHEPALDAGEHIDLRCTVENGGPSAAMVVIDVWIDKDGVVRSSAKEIASHGKMVFDVPFEIPRGLALDSTLVIFAQASDLRFHRTAMSMIQGVVHKPKLCTPGQLSRAQYDAKIAELRRALEAGDLSQDEFDRYDAELVGCLK
ncbi:MAG TPA: hypothetical protein VL463_32560 [Kofleriaceae bacterium]|jgi:hypothetical protein|nr:hypothetical protein [Kofleriaceae bacterium]